MTESRFVRYGDVTIAYRVRRVVRRTAALRIHVEADGAVTVSAPVGTSDKDVAEAVRHRAAWIWRHVQARSSIHRPDVRQWVSGESCRYLGRRYVLKIVCHESSSDVVRLAGGQLRVHTSRADRARVRQLVQAWYRARAAEWLKARVAELSARLPWVRRSPPVALRSMRSRWGSCSPAGRLTLNPLLIRAPREAVDYVIVHELCHLRHHDHGAAFYRLLGRYVPRWKEIKRRLDESAEALFHEAG